MNQNMQSKSFLQILVIILLYINLAACIDLAPNIFKPKMEAAKPQKDSGQVYAMRGGLGGIFSKGMNKLENTLNHDYQIRTYSTIWYKVDTLAELIAADRAKGLANHIVLVGHSLGGNDQIKVAQRLARKSIPVDLLITIDAVAPIKVPPNVKEVLNIYKPSFVPMFSGLVLRAENPKDTKISNINVNTLDLAVNHFTIDKNDYVQKKMIKEILSVMSQTKKVA